jgi:hypothetical protein
MCFLSREARQKEFNELILTEGRKKSYPEGMDKRISGKEAILLLLIVHRSVSSRMRAGKDLIYFESGDDVGIHSQLCGCVT